VVKTSLKNLTIIIIYKGFTEKSNFDNLIRFLYLSIYHLIKLRRVLTLINLLKFSIRNYDKLILGHFYDNICTFSSKIFRHNKLIYLDDGVSTLSIPESLKENYEIYDNLNSFNPYYKFLSKPTNFTLFTIFSDIFENGKYQIDIMQNELSFYSSMLKGKSKSNAVFFIGDPLIEDGLISKAKYDKIVFSLNSKYDLIYFPHRRESLNKIDCYKRMGIEVSITKTPFENYLLFTEIIPSKIISFNSTASVTSSILLKEYKSQIKFYYIELKEDDLEKNMTISDHMLRIQNYFRTNHFIKKNL
jgi:hypothetical protein